MTSTMFPTSNSAPNKISPIEIEYYNPFLSPPIPGSSSGSSISSILGPDFSPNPIRSNYDFDGSESEFTLGLPINSNIARRRFLKNTARNDSDVSIADIAREQKARYNPTPFYQRDTMPRKEIVWGFVEYESKVQPRANVAREEDGKSVSPKTVPAWEQRMKEEKTDGRFEGWDRRERDKQFRIVEEEFVEVNPKDLILDNEELVGKLETGVGAALKVKGWIGGAVEGLQSKLRETKWNPYE